MAHLSLVDDLSRLTMAGLFDPIGYGCGYGYGQRQLNPYMARLEQQLRQLEQQVGVGAGGGPQVGKAGFQVCLDVSHFKPSELTVKVLDNSVLVEGRHEEREDDHGYVQRHFIRRYALPQGYEAEKVTSTLSSDGVLTVQVPKPSAIEDKAAERIVQIQQVGPAHLNVKRNDKEPMEHLEQEENNGEAAK